MYTLTQQGALTGAVLAQLNANFAQIFPGSGQQIFLDPVNGLDTNDGQTLGGAVQSLAQAYALATAGQNDIIWLVSDGTTSSTARLTAGFTWAKNATHLIGISSGVNLSNRSRIAPTTTATAFANFFTVTASGCVFQNIQWFQGFGTGVAAEICLTVTGGRNMFQNCHIAGMGDTTGATDTGSRNLKISGTGENQFVNCTIGIDTVARTVANASIEFASGTPRNEFIDCVFPIFATNDAVLGLITSAAASLDRFTLFKRCLFVNSINSGSGTAIAGLATLASASGGLIVLDECTSVGVTAYGTDATSKGQMYLTGPATSNSSGIGVNPA